MKALLKTILFTLIFCTTYTAKAQQKTPKWFCEKGFWVIQSHVNTPRNCIIYFYTNDRELVYKEVVNGRKIKPGKVRMRKHLEAVLDQSVIAWQKEGIAKENLQLVASHR